MIHGVHLTSLKPDPDASPEPVFMLFCTDPALDAALFDRFLPVGEASSDGDFVRITWSLPDPQITLGTVAIDRFSAAEFQAQNQAAGSMDFIFVGEVPDQAEQVRHTRRPFYVDWLGAAGDLSVACAGESMPPVTGLGWRCARFLRERGDHAGAVRALVADVRLSVQDDVLAPDAAYALHEAALLAEARHNAEAWEYFETVTLMLYPNCHDALIGLALRIGDDPAQIVPLLARAYAIRPREDDLALYARTFARRFRQRPAALRQVIATQAEALDLTAPVFHDLEGRPFVVAPQEVIAHIQGLVG